MFNAKRDLNTIFRVSGFAMENNRAPISLVTRGRSSIVYNSTLDTFEHTIVYNEDQTFSYVSMSFCSFRRTISIVPRDLNRAYVYVCCVVMYRVRLRVRARARVYVRMSLYICICMYCESVLGPEELKRYYGRVNIVSTWNV